MSPLRFLTPGQLIICLVLFFLPWIQLSCAFPSEGTKGKDREVEEFKKETGVDPTKPIGMVNQSGLQIATGESSLSSDYKKIVEAMKKEAGGAGGAGGMMKLDDPTTKKGDTAPLLFLYPVALVGGIVLGLVPWASPARRLIVLGCCLLALGVVGIQAAIGFPLERDLKKKNEELKGFVMPGAGDPKAKTAADVFRVRWQIPLYASLLLLLGAAGTSMLGADAPPRRRKRRRYDDEDEEPLSLDDDEPEERPRRRDRDRGRYRDEEEEEEDKRPRWDRDRGRDEPRDRGGRDDRNRKGRGSGRQDDPDNPFANLD